MREPEELNFLPCAELPTEKPIIPIYYIKITAMNCYQVGDKLRTDCFVPRSVVATLHFYDAKIREIDKTLAHDGKWHILFEESDQVHIDGKRVWKKKPEQLT